MDEHRNEEDDNRALVRHTRQMRREVRNLVDPYDVCDSVFLKNFRLTKQLTRLLVRELTPLLQPCNHHLAVPNTIKVLSVLNFYASGSYQAQVGSGWLNCLGRSTVGRFIEEVTNALNNRDLQMRWIHFPSSKEERRHLSDRHQQKFHLPGVVGFIDGTEVSICTPPRTLYPQSFWTRKHHYAINCQIICDADLNILNMNASFPGASHDAFIYKFSAARRKMREAFEEEQSFWLLGDSGYPTEPWLLVPILHAAPQSAEEYYTTWHCKARNCVERCIGVLKGRFRCLLRQRALHYLPQKAGKIVKACCLLHNLCIKAGIPDADVEVVEGEEEPRMWVPQEHEAELEALENEDLDPNLVVNNRNLLEIGNVVRGRVVDFLDMQRQGML